MTEKKALPFTIPDEPVDGFVVSCYRVDLWGDSAQVDHFAYEYHVCTPWGRYSPDRPGGSDLVDTWMINEGGRCIGRMPGWQAIRRIPADIVFATHAEAVEAAVGYCTERIRLCQRRMNDLLKLRDELKDATPAVAGG